LGYALVIDYLAMEENIKVDRAQFEGVVRKLIATPPISQAQVSRKIARTARLKKKPSAPKSAQ
jgi:hypothetical protein